jgi:hypothetical protein
MDIHDWPCRIRSARQKRRLVKTDRDKQLIRLAKRRDLLWHQRANLPWLLLEKPYQSGWKRIFVLRPDVKHSPGGEFYEALLQKINTVQYDHDRSFKKKKRRKRKYGIEDRKQLLRELDTYWWNSEKLNLSEQEKACFTCVETYSIKTRRAGIKYVFTEPWRYVLKVLPNMVTHKKLPDADMEKELARIKVHIENNDLGPRIYRLTRGRRFRWKDDFNEPAKYINKLKNTPVYAYTDLET